MVTAGGSGGPFVLRGVADVTRVAALTGADAPNRTDRFDVYGTDLGSMFSFGERVYFVFGDTFGCRPPGLTGAGGDNWRSSAMAYTTDKNPADGVILDGMVANAQGAAIELLPSKKAKGEETTVIPTHGFAVGDTMYLHYMSVKSWEQPGRWTANYAGLAKSADEGMTWTDVSDVRWPGDSPFIQASPCSIQADGGSADMYFWCVPAGRFGGVRLMKVDERHIERPDGYRYFAGTDRSGEPLWSDDRRKAQCVVDDYVGELSVLWNPFLRRWIMTYLQGGGPVVIREGLAPWGPWGKPITVATQSDYPGLYAPFMHSDYVENGGETVYFALSQWGPYNVYWMKMRLVARL